MLHPFGAKAMKQWRVGSDHRVIQFVRKHDPASFEFLCQSLEALQLTNLALG
jgi:hypothetical protein